MALKREVQRYSARRSINSGTENRRSVTRDAAQTIKCLVMENDISTSQSHQWWYICFLQEHNTGTTSTERIIKTHQHCKKNLTSWFDLAGHLLDISCMSNVSLWILSLRCWMEPSKLVKRVTWIHCRNGCLIRQCSLCCTFNHESLAWWQEFLLLVHHVVHSIMKVWPDDRNSCF